VSVDRCNFCFCAVANSHIFIKANRCIYTYTCTKPPNSAYVTWTLTFYVFQYLTLQTVCNPDSRCEFVNQQEVCIPHGCPRPDCPISCSIRPSGLGFTCPTCSCFGEFEDDIACGVSPILLMSSYYSPSFFPSSSSSLK
jgi:hypothetical protein